MAHVTRHVLNIKAWARPLDKTYRSVPHATPNRLRHSPLMRYTSLHKASGTQIVLHIFPEVLAAPWHARSFCSMHTQRISVALQLAAAEEILDTILLDRGAATAAAEAAH